MYKKIIRREGGGESFVCMKEKTIFRVNNVVILQNVEIMMIYHYGIDVKIQRYFLRGQKQYVTYKIIKP